jgi:thioredoxin reductase
VAPLDYLAAARAQLAELPSVRLIDAEAARVDAGRRVTLADGATLAARAVVLATGMGHAFPDVPGLAELWGTSLVHCPFCRGWEARDARVGLLAGGDERALHLVPLLRLLSADVEVFDAIAAVRACCAFAYLPLERTGPGQPAVDAFGRTSLPGAYAAGDLAATAPAVIQALATGQRAAIEITRDLSAAA